MWRGRPPPRPWGGGRPGGGAPRAPWGAPPGPPPGCGPRPGWGAPAPREAGASPEARRLERLLADIPEPLRWLRALTVLEAIGTAEARRVLEGVAGGEPGARPTREAKASLERLARRTGG